MVVGLYLIYKHESVFAILHPVARHHAQRHIEIFCGFCFGEDAFTEFVLLHINFNVVGEHFLPEMADYI